MGDGRARGESDEGFAAALALGGSVIPLAAEAVEAALHHDARDPEQARGFGDVAVGLGHGLLDELALGGVEGGELGGERGLCAGWGAGGGRGAQGPLSTQFAALDATERKLVEEAMAQASGNVSEAARLLGITRIMMKRRLDRFGGQGD